VVGLRTRSKAALVSWAEVCSAVGRGGLRTARNAGRLRGSSSRRPRDEAISVRLRAGAPRISQPFHQLDSGQRARGWVGYEGQTVASGGSKAADLPPANRSDPQGQDLGEAGVGMDIQGLGLVLRRAHLPRTPVNRPETRLKRTLRALYRPLKGVVSYFLPSALSQGVLRVLRESLIVSDRVGAVVLQRHLVNCRSSSRTSDRTC